MMITLQRQGKDAEFITGSVDSKQFSVAYNEEKYRKMAELQEKAEEATTMADLKAIVAEFKPLTEESYKDMAETKCSFIVVSLANNKFYLKYGGQVSSIPIPKPFVDRIIKSMEKDIEFMPLIKAWVRYIRKVPGRPAFTDAQATMFAAYIDADYVDNAEVAAKELKGLSHEVATEKSTTKQVAITKEGLLVCYKVSAEITKKFIKDLESPTGVKQVERFDYNVDEISGEKDFITPDSVEDRVFEPIQMHQSGDPFLCGDALGHIIRVGKVHALPDWKQVSTPAHKGLHVGGLRYIDGYRQRTDAVTHYVFVDPMDIHTIGSLGYGNDGAMTVRRYFVYGSFAGENRNIYHSSEYAKMTDEEWANVIKQVVEETQMSLKETQSLLVADKKTKDGTVPLATSQVFGQ